MADWMLRDDPTEFTALKDCCHDSEVYWWWEDKLEAALEIGAHAQVKKLVEWLSSDCLNHKHNLTPRWRCRCWECMEELRHQVGFT